MPLNLPDGISCFVDANIFYYHFVETPPVSDSSTAFLQRVAEGGIIAYSSTHVLAEAIHKIMLAEAASRFDLNRAGLVNWLQKSQERIRELAEFQDAARELEAMKLVCLPVDVPLLVQAAECSRQMGLLTNDAIIVALMQRHALTHLVSNDDDFDRVVGLTVWKPRA
jgi:predicted nucleic acid-binding protein